MISPKITLVKSVSTGNIEVCIQDSIHMVPGQVFLIPEGGISLEDHAADYKRKIASLERKLEYAKRAKQHILTNLRKHD
jgi:hypothetical protein